MFPQEKIEVGSQNRIRCKHLTMNWGEFSTYAHMIIHRSSDNAKSKNSKKVPHICNLNISLEKGGNIQSDGLYLGDYQLESTDSCYLSR